MSPLVFYSVIPKCDSPFLFGFAVFYSKATVEKFIEHFRIKLGSNSIALSVIRAIHKHKLMISACGGIDAL